MRTHDGRELGGVDDVRVDIPLDMVAAQPHVEKPAPKCSIRRQAYNAALVAVPNGLVFTRFLSKAVMTYYGAKTFVKHNPDLQKNVPIFAAFIHWGMPLIDGVQSYFTSGSTGKKNVKKLMQTPGLELRSLCQFVKSHPGIAAEVAFRITGDAIVNAMVMSDTFANVPLLGQGGATAIAIVCAGVNGFADMKFSGSGDVRLLKRMTCQSSQREQVEYNGHKVSVLELLSAVNLTGANSVKELLNDLDACKRVRHHVRHSQFRADYYRSIGLEPGAKPTPKQRWHFEQLQTELIASSSRYSKKVEWSSRINTMLVNLPFLYLRFFKNKEFAQNHFGSIAAVVTLWAVIQLVLKVVTSQGRPVEGLSDAYDKLDSGSGKRMAAAAKHKPHAAAFCLLGILPYTIFGLGQLLDMHNKTDAIDADVMVGITWTLVVVFILAQLPSYLGFVGSRIFKKMPEMPCCGTKPKDSGNALGDALLGDTVRGGSFDGELAAESPEKKHDVPNDDVTSRTPTPDDSSQLGLPPTMTV